MYRLLFSRQDIIPLISQLKENLNKLPTVSYSNIDWTREACELARTVDKQYNELSILSFRMKEASKAMDTISNSDSDDAEEGKKVSDMISIIEDMELVISTLNSTYNKLLWPRYYLVTSSIGGHLHSHENCSTCNHGDKETEFALFVNSSAMKENELVDVFGELCCSVCFKSAPVAKVEIE